jgi:uncharacterized membrane protein
MLKWFVAAAVAWPVLAGAAVLQRSTSHPAAWTTVVYLAASRVCHQRPDRSFQTAGVQWPVCARCSGLYLGAAAAAAFLLSRRRLLSSRTSRMILLVAAVPTAITWAVEWVGGVNVSNTTRAVVAFPLGAAISAAIALVLAHRPQENYQVN